MDGVIFETTGTQTRICCISLDGLKMLYDLKMMGEQLPKGWQALVWKYLQQKSRSMHRKQEELERLRKQYMEAVAISRSLHVKEEKTG